jgi:hypothetical protein
VLGCNKVLAPAFIFIAVYRFASIESSNIPIMNSSLSASTKVVFPEGWRTSAFAQLSAQENVLAWLEVDLNAQLHFR